MEACWAPLPDQRPTASEIEIATLNLQRGSTTNPITNNGRSFAIAETQLTAGRKHVCPDCDMAFVDVSQLNDHIKTHRMSIRECLILAVFNSS
jgi:hypothetical protein